MEPSFKNRSLAGKVYFALQGIAVALRSEANFRLQAVGAVCTIVLFAWLGLPPLWWTVVILAISLVLGFELLNSALERLADFLHPAVHPEIKAIKDMAAAAVLIVGLGALLVGLLVLFGRN